MDFENLFPKIVFNTLMNQFEIRVTLNVYVFQVNFIKIVVKPMLILLTRSYRDYETISKRWIKEISECEQRTINKKYGNLLGRLKNELARVSFCFVRDI